VNDMSSTIVAKSDQINAADLVGTTRTITIREVRITNDDQPVSVYFEGDSKAFRPCKGVRRLMVRVWGLDANKYVGQSMTLFQDPTVTWAGKPEGGIRVSHMTGLSEPITEAMRTSRNATKPYVIKPLDMGGGSAPKADRARAWTDDFKGQIVNAADLPALENFLASKAAKLDELKAKRPDLHAECETAIAVRRGGLAPDDNGFDDEPTNDAPAADDTPRPDRSGFVSGLTRRIETAATDAELDEVQADLNAEADNLDEDTVGELDRKIAARRRVLAKGQG
jgi:hypothetical protein